MNPMSTVLVLTARTLSDRVQCLDFYLDLAMELAEVTQDTGNRHVLGPRGARNRETLTLASHRPPGGEHRTVCLREDLPRML